MNGMLCAVCLVRLEQVDSKKREDADGNTILGVIVIRAWRAAAKLMGTGVKAGVEDLPMSAVTMVNGTAVCWGHVRLGVTHDEDGWHQTGMPEVAGTWLGDEG